MKMKHFGLKIIPTLTLLAAVSVSPAQASYVCTGETGPADATSPYFNGDLTDTSCDIDEVEAVLGITIDESLIIGSKSNSIDDPITDWGQDEYDLGMLEITATTDTSGTWTLTGDIEPLFFVEKYNGSYDIYTYMGVDTSPFSDSWFRQDGKTTSHISVYGAVPVPAAVWLFGSGLLGLVGISRRKKAA